MNHWDNEFLLKGGIGAELRGVIEETQKLVSNKVTILLWTIQVGSVP